MSEVNSDEVNSDEADIPGWRHIWRNSRRGSKVRFCMAMVVLLVVAAATVYFFFYNSFPDKWSKIPRAPFMAAPLFLPLCILWGFSWTQIGRRYFQGREMNAVNKQLQDFVDEDDKIKYDKTLFDKIKKDEILFVKRAMAEDSKTDSSVALLALLASIMALLGTLKEPTQNTLLLAGLVLFLVGAGAAITIHGQRLEIRRYAAVLIAERQKQSL